ncbi:MAG: hypothetical protein V1722_05800 [Candidatus Micrarchaeota archaeon]
MNWLTIVICLAGLVALYFLPTTTPFYPLETAVQHVGEQVTTNGFSTWSQLCDKKVCIKTYNLRVIGQVTVTGTIEKKGGETRIIVRRIE